MKRGTGCSQKVCQLSASLGAHVESSAVNLTLVIEPLLLVSPVMLASTRGTLACNQHAVLFHCPECELVWSKYIIKDQCCHG